MARTMSAHIVTMPHPGFLVMRVFQIVLAFIVLALCAAEAYWFSVDYVVPDGVALAIFTVSLSLCTAISCATADDDTLLVGRHLRMPGLLPRLDHLRARIVQLLGSASSGHLLPRLLASRLRFARSLDVLDRHILELRRLRCHGRCLRPQRHRVVRCHVGQPALSACNWRVQRLT